MAQYVVFTVGRDRPGIVAAVTGALYALGGNLLDTSMTVLSGHFAVALAVDAPVDEATLVAALTPVADRLELGLSVLPISGGEHPRPAGPRFVVSVYGADHSGIVARVTALLAEHGVNIVDLETRRVGAADDPVYAMLLEVALPVELTAVELSEALSLLAEELGVEASLHEADADIL